MSLSAEELFSSLITKVPFQALREIMLALHGKKVARLSLPEAKVGEFVECLESAALVVGLHDRKQILSEDMGKGGWVSGYGLEVPLEFPHDGYILLYTGKDAQKVMAAKRAEHSNNFDRFGQLLGYPDCCIEFYKRALPAAEMEQGDFLLQLLDASVSRGTLPLFSGWANIAAQYFGYGLISFYPCTLFCAKAQSQAREAYEIIGIYDPALAQKAYEKALTAVLYTEYEGIYAFPGASRQGNQLYYNGANVECTLNGVLADIITRGNNLKIHSAHCAEIYSDNQSLGVLRGSHLGMFIFE